jgi:hypothetical protein
VSQGDFDGVIEAYRHALDAFLKLMIEVATAGRRRAAPSDLLPALKCQTEVGGSAAGARFVSPAFAIPSGITPGERDRASRSSCAASTGPPPAAAMRLAGYQPRFVERSPERRGGERCHRSASPPGESH